MADLSAEGLIRLRRACRRPPRQCKLQLSFRVHHELQLQNHTVSILFHISDLIFRARRQAGLLSARAFDMSTRPRAGLNFDRACSSLPPCDMSQDDLRLACGTHKQHPGRRRAESAPSPAITSVPKSPLESPKSTLEFERERARVQGWQLACELEWEDRLKIEQDREYQLPAELSGHCVPLGGATPLRAYLSCLLPEKGPEQRGWSVFVNGFLERRAEAGRPLFREIPQAPQGFTKTAYALPFERIVKQLTTTDASPFPNAKARYTIIPNVHPVDDEPDMSIIFSARPAVADHIDKTLGAIRNFPWRGDWEPVIVHGVQVFHHVQQLMAEKPPRRFVITFTVTGRFLRLFAFDRCGTMHSDAVDLRQHPAILVYLALLALVDPVFTGMDPNPVESPTGWTITLPAGISIDPNSSSGPAIFEVHPSHLRAGLDLRGRGTTCWLTLDETKDE